MSDAAIPQEVLDLSFEEALDALDGVVAKLESGRAPLEESISLYTRGTALKAHCQNKLRDAQARVEKLTIDASGQVSGSAPFDTDD